MHASVNEVEVPEANAGGGSSSGSRPGQAAPGILRLNQPVNLASNAFLRLLQVHQLA